MNTACNSCRAPIPDEDLFPYNFYDGSGHVTGTILLCSPCLCKKTPDMRHPQFVRSEIPKAILDAFPGITPLPDGLLPGEPLMESGPSDSL